MKPISRQFRDFFVSLKLTIVLLVLSIILIFWATLSQVDLGVWGVQEKFFHSFFVLEKIPGTKFAIPVFPGGYSIGGFLLINLIAAHIYRFKLAGRKLGIQLTHFGIILLLIGELLSGIFQKESQMPLNEGETKNYSESYRDVELAVMDTTDPKYNEVVAIPQSVLRDGGTIQHPSLPFQVKIRDYYPNAMLQMRTQVPNAAPAVATSGIGPRVALIPLPLTYKADERNSPATDIELVGTEGSLGTWLLSPLLGMPQTVTHQGHTWELALRFKRYYRPFALTLLKFTHEIYAGTDIPKNFASHLQLKSADGHEDREVLIYMNNPLRYAGLTFYQASFDPSNNHNTVLQVVRNPSWVLPYVSCILMALGLVIQFGMHLIGFIRKRSAV